MDRGINYQPLIDFLVQSPVPHIILMSDSGRRIMQETEDCPDSLKSRLICAADLPEAVRIAKRVTAKGKICLMSPAAASYNVYKNFEKRGEHFAQLAAEQNGD